MDFFKISTYILWIVVIIQTVLIYYLSKFVVSFLNNLRVINGQAVSQTLPIGDKVPLFREYDQGNQEVKLSNNEGRHTLLIFASNECVYCTEIISKIKDVSQMYNLRTIVISKQSLNFMHTPEISFIVSEMIFKNYKIKSTPTILLLDEKNHLISYIDTMHSHGLSIHLENYFRNKLIAKNMVV